MKNDIYSRYNRHSFHRIISPLFRLIIHSGPCVIENTKRIRKTPVACLSIAYNLKYCLLFVNNNFYRSFALTFVHFKIHTDPFKDLWQFCYVVGSWMTNIFRLS